MAGSGTGTPALHARPGLAGTHDSSFPSRCLLAQAPIPRSDRRDRPARCRAARRAGHAVGAHPVEEGFRVPARHPYLAKCRLVEDARALERRQPVQSATASQRTVPRFVSDAGDTAAPGQNARDAGVLVDPRSPRSGALHEGRAEVGRADPTVVRGPDGADDVVRVHQRPALLCLDHRNGLSANAEQVCQRLLAPDVNKPIRGGGNRQRALVDPAGRLSGFRLQAWRRAKRNSG